MVAVSLYRAPSKESCVSEIVGEDTGDWSGFLQCARVDTPFGVFISVLHSNWFAPHVPRGRTTHLKSPLTSHTRVYSIIGQTVVKCRAQGGD